MWAAAFPVTEGLEAFFVVPVFVIFLGTCMAVNIALATRGCQSGFMGSVANFADRPTPHKLPATVSTDQQAMIEFKGSHFGRAAILGAVRWYMAYPISYRQLEEMLEEHGVEVDHSTLNRWVLKYVPLLEQELQACKQPVGPSWRMDETYVKVKGSWKYLYRAVDKAGAAVDFLLTAKRDRKAALRFLRKAIKRNGTPQ
jgi:DDE domain